jgi:hypothetical protein
LNALTTRTISYDFVEFSAKSAIPNGQNREGKTMFTIAEVNTWLGWFDHGPNHIGDAPPKVRTFH